jgi:hypothetical protein
MKQTQQKPTGRNRRIYFELAQSRGRLAKLRSLLVRAQLQTVVVLVHPKTEGGLVVAANDLHVENIGSEAVPRLRVAGADAEVTELGNTRHGTAPFSDNNSLASLQMLSLISLEQSLP